MSEEKEVPGYRVQLCKHKYVEMYADSGGYVLLLHNDERAPSTEDVVMRLSLDAALAVEALIKKLRTDVIMQRMEQLKGAKDKTFALTLEATTDGHWAIKHVDGVTRPDPNEGGDNESK